MSLFHSAANWFKVLKLNKFDEEQLKTFQKQRLRQLLKYAAGHSEYYKKKYRGIDIDKCTLQELPTVTKEEMMANFDLFVTDRKLILTEIQKWLEYEHNDGRWYLNEYRPFLTSGSTGRNAVIAYHRKYVDIVLANLYANSPFIPTNSIANHVQTIAGCQFGRRPRLALILAPRGNIAQFFKYLVGKYRLLVSFKVFSISDPFDQVVEGLNEFQPDQLVSLTYFLELLAHEQLAGRLFIQLSHPMSFIAGAGELVTQHAQELALRAWDMRIQNIYGSMECYLMAMSCRDYGNLHLMSHLCMIEIVDRNNRPIKKGQYGEKILLTNLFNFVQPIIRYEIGDITGYSNQRCPCGSSFPVLLPVKGRSVNFFYFKKPDGEYIQVAPTFLQIALYHVFEIKQCQVVQTSRNSLTVVYVPMEGMSNIAPKLINVLNAALVHKGLEDIVALELKKVASIRRDERSGKYNPFVSMGPPQHSEKPAGNN